MKLTTEKEVFEFIKQEFETNKKEDLPTIYICNYVDNLLYFRNISEELRNSCRDIISSNRDLVLKSNDKFVTPITWSSFWNICSKDKTPLTVKVRFLQQLIDKL